MNALLKFRQSNSLTQEALAALLGTTKATVSRWEAGIRKPSPDAARRIEKATKGKVTRRQIRPDIFDAPNSLSGSAA